MTAPIPISSGPPASTIDTSTKPLAAQAQAQLGHGHQPSTSISSTTSSGSDHSPQTPFSPSFSLSPNTATGPSAAGTSPNPKSPILQWASTSFGALGKSPNSAPINVPHFNHGHDHEHDHESHDAFEFGDISDMNRSSWTGHSRRAASMSNPSGTAAAVGSLGSSPNKPSGQGGISAMLSGFGASGGGIGSGGVPNNASGVPVGSPPSVAGGVFAENAAKGQGLLRRLSLGGAGRGRPTIAPPPAMPQTQPTVPAPIPAQAPPTDNGKLAPDTGGVGFAQRGRRYSENPGAAGKKRGVSPMGERILRDHGHF